MEFTDKELISIYTCLEVMTEVLEQKKNKSKNDILALNKIQKISEKINNYMEEKERK